MGFGAERANLIAEQPVTVPEAAVANPYAEQIQGHEEEVKQEESSADVKLREQANTAKNQLLQEIQSFQDSTAAAGTNQELEQTPIEHAFNVRDPVAVGSVIKYVVSGADKQGQFTAQRRYNEFETLRRALYERWPGCYIPSIPEKVTVNINVDKMTMQSNKDAAFVEERRSLLERFIREISMFDFLIESKEFQIFARGQGEVTDQLEKLPKQSPTEILEKYKLNFSIDEE
jgi:hypothetical protein